MKADYVYPCGLVVGTKVKFKKAEYLNCHPTVGTIGTVVDPPISLPLRSDGMMEGQDVGWVEVKFDLWGTNCFKQCHLEVMDV